MTEIMTTFKMDERLKERIKQEAKKENRSVSAMLRVLLTESLSIRDGASTEMKDELLKLRVLTELLVGNQDKPDDSSDKR